MRGDGRRAVLVAPEAIEVRREPLPPPAAGEVRIRVAACGLCGSDLKIYRGRHPTIAPPAVLGHEFWGEPEERGPGADVADRPHVVFPPLGCGRCSSCRRGEERLCEALEVIGGHRPGGLSELVDVPADHLLAIDDDVAEPLRVLIEPLAVAVHAVERGALAGGERILVLGGGAIGTLVALTLRRRGHEDVRVADLDRRRLAIAAADGIATEPADDGAGDEADVVFECVGQLAAAALARTRRGGRTILVGGYGSDASVPGLPIQRHERTVVGVQMYGREDFRAAMRLLAAGLFPAGLPSDALFDEIVLERVPEALAAMAAGDGRRGALKTVVRPARG